MERRMRPIAHALNEAVLDRLEMNVVNMSLKIVLIANRVLPESSLPQQQIPFEARAMMIPASISALVKCPLIRRHLPEKSASAGGKVNTAWR
jgi:hypothetical protein